MNIVIWGQIMSIMSYVELSKSLDKLTIIATIILDIRLWYNSVHIFYLLLRT